MQKIKFYLKCALLLPVFLVVLIHPYAMEKDEEGQNHFSLLDLPPDIIKNEISKHLCDQQVNALKFTRTYFHEIFKNRIYPFKVWEIEYRRSFNTQYLGNTEIKYFEPYWDVTFRVLIKDDETDYYFKQLKSRLREKHIYDIRFSDESVFLKWSQRGWLQPFRGLALGMPWQYFNLSLSGIKELTHSHRLSHLKFLKLNHTIIETKATPGTLQSLILKQKFFKFDKLRNMSHPGDASPPQLKVIYQVPIQSLLLKRWETFLNLINLQNLDLSSGGLNPKDIQTLVKAKFFHQLKSLNLSSNSIGDEGIKALGEKPCLPNLTYLDLSFCHLGIEGINALVTINNIPNLIHLNLSGNHLDSKALKILGNWSILLNLYTLKLTGNCHTRLRQIDGKHFIEADTLTEWPILSKLKELDLSNDTMNIEEVQHLAKGWFAPNLKRLNLGYNKIHGDVISPLVEFSVFAQLESLNLRGIKIDTQGLLYLAKALKYNTSLRKLNLEYSDIREFGVWFLLQHLKKNTTLEQLYLWEYENDDEEGVWLLETFRKHNTTLKDIDLPERPKNDVCSIL